MVALPGPPLVMVQKRSKAMIELMVVRIITRSSIGRSQGSVIRVKRSTGPAPSMRAARSRLSGSDCRPARTRRQVSGAWFQTWTRATMWNAQLPSASQGMLRSMRPRSKRSAFRVP